MHFICSFVSLQSPTFKSTRRRRSPPSKNHQTELKFQLQNPHFKPHNTAPITFKLHFSLFSNSHNTGILHSIYIYIYILLMFLLCLYCNSLFYFVFFFFFKLSLLNSFFLNLNVFINYMGFIVKQKCSIFIYFMRVIAVFF